MNWQGPSAIVPLQYVCGYCGNKVASNLGIFAREPLERGNSAYVYICPNCDKPTYFCNGVLVPSAAPGNNVANLPSDINSLYSEARRASAASAHTAAVLVCRKLLMNIAVAQGAKIGGTFMSYVEYLSNANYVPPNGKGWVDHIRRKGNEATHEIALMTASESSDLIAFSEMLLKFIYEFPSRVPPPPPAP